MRVNSKTSTLILSSIFILFIIILYLSEGYYGGADSLVHYMYSRYSWQNPSFLLSHWAKPVFTLLASPFAQFGHVGVSVFNILNGILTAFLCYKIVFKLDYKIPWYVIFLLCFTPVYAINMLTGLTEVLFGTIIVWSIYLCFYEYFILAAIVASFIPLARTEGIFILPIIAMYVLIKKKYSVLPWFLTGTVLYSIIGYFYYHDFFWLITEMPYRGATDVYGTGPLLHFVKHSPIFLGVPVIALTLIGLIYLMFRFLKDRKTYQKQVILVVLPFLVYFSAHSVMWWSGIGNSLGLHRYMAAIAPFIAILSLFGLNYIIEFLEKKQISKRILYAFLTILSILILIVTFDRYDMPQKLSGADKLMKEASNYIIENNLLENKIYYYDPAFFYFLDINPFDEEQCKSHVYNPEKPEQGIENRSIVIWDAHFSPILKLEKDTMLNSQYFELLNVFKPENNIKAFGRDYEILIFQRVDSSNTESNIVTYNEKSIIDNDYKQIHYQNFDMEEANEDNSIIVINDTNKIFQLDSTMNFALTYSLKNKIEEKNLYCEIEIIIDDSLIDKCPHLVIEKRHWGKLIEYFATNKLTETDSKNTKIKLEAGFIKSMQKKDEIRVYVWNSSKINCFLDNFSVRIK